MRKLAKNLVKGDEFPSQITGQVYRVTEVTDHPDYPPGTGHLVVWAYDIEFPRGAAVRFVVGDAEPFDVYTGGYE